MPSPLRWPSRSVRVPGRVNRPVRLGHQSTGSFFVPYAERPDTGDEPPRCLRGPVIPPRTLEHAGAADPGADDAAEAEASPAGAGAPDPGPAGPGSAGPGQAGADRPGPDRLPRRTPGSSRAAPGVPPRVPARQGPPPRVPARPGPPPGSAPGAAVPAVRTDGAPATQPAAAPATRPGAAPAAQPGAAPATRPAAGAPARRPATEPTWSTVLATTVRLWAKRRLANRWLRALLVLVLAAIVFLAGALTATLTRGNTTGGPAAGQRTSHGGSAALAAVASARTQAAAWVAQQVNPDEVIGCDPVMCTALERAHVQANRLLVLGPSLPDPLGSEILLDTATLRSQFGRRLTTVYAPVSLAAFGSGAAHIEVRFVAPGGAHAYLAELATDVAARRAAGTEMLRSHSIHASPAARRRLAAGRVDTRLLVVLVTLAHDHPVDIISFGANQAGASPGVPLRSAEITGAPGPGGTPAVSVTRLRSFLSSLRPPYRPSIIAVTNASRRTVLRVGYPAPSLLGLLGTHG